MRESNCYSKKPFTKNSNEIFSYCMIDISEINIEINFWTRSPGFADVFVGKNTASGSVEDLSPGLSDCRLQIL
jgi:hypothetical protein